MKNGWFTGLLIAVIGILIAAVVIGILLFTGVFEVNDRFKNNQKITIIFDTAGGSIIKDMKIDKNTSIKLPTPIRDSYEFDGWYLDNEAINDDYKFSEDVTITAKWSALTNVPKTFKISFNSNGGSKVNTITINCGDEVKLPKNPTKNGYDFISWADQHGKVILDGALLTCDDITLYANWEKKVTTNSGKQTKTESYVDESYTKTESYQSGELDCADDEEIGWDSNNRAICVKKAI